MSRPILLEPFGKNDLPADYMFFQRKYYNTEPIIYPLSLLKPIDIWIERPRFGKIDTQEKYVVSNPDSLKIIYKDLAAIDFVADAYTDLSNFVMAAANAQRTSITSMIPIDKPTKAWEDVNEFFHHYYINVVDDAFTNVFLTRENKNSVVGFNSYVDLFIDFVQANPTFPATQVTYLASNKVSNRVSGLIIEFTNDLYDYDNIKWKKFLSNDFFADYAKLAGAYGFYINKHIPWSIVANLNSKAMKKYMANYGIGSTQQCFNTNYLPAEYLSFELFKKYIWMSYLTFTSYQPQIETDRVKNFIRNSVYASTFTTQIRRSPRPMELIKRTWQEFLETYPEDYLLEKYLKIRLLENQTPLDGRRYKNFLRQVKRRKGNFGIVNAFEYISKVLLSQRKKKLAKSQQI